ncbi:MAG: hypothetical protein ACJAXV_000327 [Bacteroidia bacterium]
MEFVETASSSLQDVIVKKAAKSSNAVNILVIDFIYNKSSVFILLKQTEMNCLHRVIVYDNFYIPCIYRNWFSKEVDADIKTVSILTRKANAFFQEIDNKHLMMPVILKEDKVQSYLSGKTSLDEYYNDEYFDKLEFMKSRR